MDLGLIGMTDSKPRFIANALEMFKCPAKLVSNFGDEYEFLQLFLKI
jgi:hypothetical protein